MTKIVKRQKTGLKPLTKTTACYVLITCSEPNSEGQMEVELSYDGDEILASYLIENAAQVFDDYTNQTLSQ